MTRVVFCLWTGPDLVWYQVNCNSCHLLTYAEKCQRQARSKLGGPRLNSRPREILMVIDRVSVWVIEGVIHSWSKRDLHWKWKVNFEVEIPLNHCIVEINRKTFVPLKTAPNLKIKPHRHHVLLPATDFFFFYFRYTCLKCGPTGSQTVVNVCVQGCVAKYELP